VSCLEEILPYVDLVLVMSVNPGFGGQSFIERSLAKIGRVRAMLDELGSNAELEVDGGIDIETAPPVVRAGADVLVAGSAIFGSDEGIAGAIAGIRAAARG
jgi:ribulose-phosphate 3-epimerase